MGGGVKDSLRTRSLFTKLVFVSVVFRFVGYVNLLIYHWNLFVTRQ